MNVKSPPNVSIDRTMSLPAPVTANHIQYGGTAAVTATVNQTAVAQSSANQTAAAQPLAQRRSALGKSKFVKAFNQLKKIIMNVWY